MLDFYQLFFRQIVSCDRILTVFFAGYLSAAEARRCVFKVYNRAYIRIPLLIAEGNTPNDLHSRRHIGAGIYRRFGSGC